jgi:hypothetical protein
MALGSRVAADDADLDVVREIVLYVRWGVTATA